MWHIQQEERLRQSLPENPDGMRPNGRARHGWEENIQMNQEME
jgi:hypothetical protein